MDYKVAEMVPVVGLFLCLYVCIYIARSSRMGGSVSIDTEKKTRTGSLEISVRVSQWRLTSSLLGNVPF